MTQDLELLYPIDDNIPIPKKGDRLRKRGIWWQQLSKMKINQSCLIPLDGKTAQKRQSIILSAARIYRQRTGETQKFTSRIEPGGIRVWRIE